MTGLERIQSVLAGHPTDRLPVLPMLHTGLAGIFGVPLGQFFTSAEAMANVMIAAQRRFGFDGVQLTLGVVGEVEALGAKTEQPEDGAPILRENLLADLGRLDGLRGRDPTRGGRMPLFFGAVSRVVETVGRDTFVLATMRGPMLIASQLRKPETILVDMLESPDEVARMLDFSVEVVLRVARPLLSTGAHGILLGEATCSPSFISPALYRQLILSRHQRLVAQLKAMGWTCVGLHVCGNITAILDDLISTGVDFFDVDYQVDAAQVARHVANRVALRGNLDPSADFRFGSPEKIKASTRALCRAVAGTRWIAGSGCDIPAGTPAENLAAFVQTVREAE
ncbi:MAG: uroporphyrinogen decarboxylase family protein [Candidatus Sumerlaeia bacterium]|nr:uroporphyrinogen decarboxylase family protein [Candidatus Sumerlaeia bacterium]